MRRLTSSTIVMSYERAPASTWARRCLDLDAAMAPPRAEFVSPGMITIPRRCWGSRLMIIASWFMGVVAPMFRLIIGWGICSSSKNIWDSSLS